MVALNRPSSSALTEEEKGQVNKLSKQLKHVFDNSDLSPERTALVAAFLFTQQAFLHCQTEDVLHMFSSVSKGANVQTFILKDDDDE